MTPDGAVRTETPEELRGDRMNQQQAWPDFADWRNVRTGQEQVQMPKESGEKAMISPKEVVGYAM
jgi:hypothetical protein